MLLNFLKYWGVNIISKFNYQLENEKYLSEWMKLSKWMKESIPEAVVHEVLQ